MNLKVCKPNAITLAKVKQFNYRLYSAAGKPKLNEIKSSQHGDMISYHECIYKSEELNRKKKEKLNKNILTF